MERLLAERNIKHLFHFTQAQNIPSILDLGLLPRDTIDRCGIQSAVNDEFRYDKCESAVCTSIEFPNYKMFYKLRIDNPQTEWAVFRLDARVLCDFTCAYCYTNAGSAEVYSLPLSARIGEKAFLHLFEDRLGRPTRAERNLSDRYPTDPQAEVLVFGRIPVWYITGIYFNNHDTMSAYRKYVPDHIDVRVNGGLFSYRMDYLFDKV